MKKYVKVTDRAPRVGDIVRVIKPTIVPETNGVYDYMVGSILKIIDIEKNNNNYTFQCEDSFSYRYAEGTSNNGCERRLDREEFEVVEEVDEFTKSDLEPCMVVELRDGDLYIVSKSKEGLCFINKGVGYLLFDSYNEELLNINEDKYWDIMKVYDFAYYHCKSNDISKNHRDLLFERKDEPKLSARDIKIKELQEQMDSIKRELDRLKDED